MERVPGKAPALRSLEIEGDPRSHAQEGTAGDTSIGLARALDARSRSAVLAEFGFLRRADGQLTPPQRFSWAVRGYAALKSGAREPAIRCCDERSLGRQTVRATLLRYFKTAQMGELTSTVPGPSGRPVKIRYAAFLPPDGVPIRGVVHFMNGCRQSMLRSAELAYALREHRAAGYALVMHDHRGQGFSDRLLDDPLKGYVGRFDDYVDDAERVSAMLKRKLAPRMAEGAKWCVAGHSMGAAVATSCLLDQPEMAAGFLALSPMYGIKTGIPKGFARAIVRTLAALERGEPGYVPGAGPDGMRGGRGKVTGSEARYALMSWLDGAYPTLRLGGPTRQWLDEALGVCETLQATAHRLRVPSWMARSLEDRVVEPAAQSAVARAGGFITRDYAVAPGESEPVGHTLVSERDRIQHEVTGMIANLMTTGRAFG